MKHLSTLAALLITAASFAAPLTGAMAADAPAKLANGALVDANGALLYPIISWKCPRTAAVMADIRRYFDPAALQRIQDQFKAVIGQNPDLHWPL